MYYKNAAGVLICFDLTDYDSLDALSFWLTDLDKHAPPNLLKVLCGLKSDLDDNRQVPEDDALKFAKANNLEYIEVSSKEGTNVEDAFMKLAMMMADDR